MIPFSIWFILFEPNEFSNFYIAFLIYFFYLSLSTLVDKLSNNVLTSEASFSSLSLPYSSKRNSKGY